MVEINFIILGIIILFFILLAMKSIIGKNKIKENFCVICASISLTWIVLLFLYLFDLFDNILIISLLMGMSVTGIYYFAESKIGKANKLKIFRLPFIITLIVIAYYILTFENIVNIDNSVDCVAQNRIVVLENFGENSDTITEIIYSILIVMALWLLFILVYFYNDTKFIKKLLECCKE